MKYYQVEHKIQIQVQFQVAKFPRIKVQEVRVIPDIEKIIVDTVNELRKI